MYKVCHVSSAHPQKDIRIFQKECITLAEEGYDVYLVSQGESNIDKCVKVIGIGKQPSNRLMRVLFFSYKAYKSAKKLDADVYHFHDPELLPYARKMKKKGKKVIYDSHEFTTLQMLGGARSYIPESLRRMVASCFRNYEQKTTKRIDGVIIPCKWRGKDYFEGNYARIAYVNNVPRLSDYPYKSDRVTVEKSTCYVGAITRERGIINTIKGSYKAGCTLHLIGYIEPDLLEEIKTMPEYEKVRYYGVLPVYEFVKIIGQVEVGLCLLKNVGQYDEGDNLSTKIYEYMAMGIPIVASNFRMNKEILCNYGCGICVNPESVDEIAEAIISIRSDKKMANEMGRKGRELAESKFCWEKEKNNLLELYETLLKS